MRYSIALLSLTAFFALPAIAQKGPCTEEFIKARVGQENPWPKTDDYYLFNPLLDKPIVGTEEREKFNKANEPAMTKRKNVRTTPFKTERVVVSPSGDMAYEYGTGEISYDDGDTGKHVETTLARLSVWKADGESCRAAATMLQREGPR